MTPAPLDSPLTAPLFGDAEAAAILSDRAFIARMIEVEAALALASAEVGLIPAAAGGRIAAALAGLQLAPEALGPGMASAGVPVPALVKQLQAALGADAGWLHWGATSQDIVDSAQAMQWRALLALLGGRLGGLIDALQAASAAADQPMAGRTRSQIATPITLGLRLAGWAQPLIGLEAELPALRGRLLRVQFGGASGSAAVAGDHAAALSAALARRLGLRDAPCWHGDRSGVVSLGAWLAALTAALAKLARDLIVMGRSEIGEARAGTGGGSSTMPQKSNPVAAEAVVTLAALTASLQPALALAASPLEERDGAAWALEWLALPQMGMAAATALRHAAGLIDTLAPAPERMAAHLAADHASALSEAASFALAAHMPRPDAQALVAEALAAARAEGLSLPAALARHPRAAGLADWPATLTPQAQAAPARAMAQRIFAGRAPRPTEG